MPGSRSTDPLSSNDVTRGTTSGSGATDPTVGVLDPTTPSEPGGGLRGAELPRGSRIGRYLIERLIGRGGMGYVYAAKDTQLDRQVALKMLHSTHDARGAELMVHEAKALARLDDIHVVQIYDAGEVDGHVFIAMQLVDGEDLATAIRRRPSSAQLVAWFVDAGRGLAAAHSAGLVHRDFKPGNVLIDRSGRVAVSDFGLARDVADERGQPGLGTIMGTPAYMAPEQHSQQPATEASDQFAFCVALWEALCGQHPFIDGDRGAMSPFAIGLRILDGIPIPAPRGARISRKQIDVLTRGLARDPAQRWPSMTVLLAELAPAQRRRRIWPYAVAAAVVAGGASAAAVTLLRRDGPPACAAVEAERGAAVWSQQTAALLRDQFVKTGRPYAEGAARTITSALDGYTTHWVALATDACTAEHTGAASPADLVARRRACLDGRLDALRGVVAAMTTKVLPEVVDQADQVERALPDVGDCTDATAEAPAGNATERAQLEVDLGTARIHVIAGDQSGVSAVLDALVARADSLGEPSLQTRALRLRGEARLEAIEPARADLMHAAEIAIAHGLERDATRALGLAAQAAALDGAKDALAAITPVLRATAARTHDRRLEVLAETDLALAKVHGHDSAAALDACRQAMSDAQQLGDGLELRLAEKCMLAALTSQGAYTELVPLLARGIARVEKALGPDAPEIADYLDVETDIDVRQGKLAEARAAAEKSLAIRKRVYSATHFRLGRSYQRLGYVADAEGKSDEARRDDEQALAVCDDTQPAQQFLAIAMHTSLAMRDAGAESPNLPDAFAHFDKALALARERYGTSAVEVALVLLNYGQVKAGEDLDAGLAMLAEARDILESRHDKRARLAAGALMAVANNALRWPDARKYAEEALARVDADSEPSDIALMKDTLARALVMTHGDRARARQLEREARDLLAKLGPGYADQVKTMDTWLAKH